MIFSAIPDGSSVFLDANVLVYHFTAHFQYGTACTDLLQRVGSRHIAAFLSSHVLSDVAHRLMTIEAMTVLGWPQTSLAARLRKHHDQIPKLTLYRQAIASIKGFGIQILPVTETIVDSAAIVSQQHELLLGDALIVAVMQDEAIVHLASRDGDFDRIAGITRYGPA